MRWQFPLIFYLFFLLPVLFFIFYQAHQIRKKRIQHFGLEVFQKKIFESIHGTKRLLKALLILLGFSFLLLTLASPQTSGKVKVQKKLGSEFFLALDTSLSMLAQDEKPSRFLRAKEEMGHLLDRMEGYKVGLIIFAGTPFVQCPLTVDHSAVRYFIESVNTQSLPVPGTALKKVIQQARKSFGEEKGTQKYLVLFTDGEDLEGEDPVSESREASREGIAIFAIGFGSPSGTVIPLYEKGGLAGYKKDAQGVTVTTRLEESLLMEITQATRSRYFKSTKDEKELEEFLQEVARRGKKEMEEKSEIQYQSRFQIPLFLCFLFLLTEMILSEVRKV